MNFRIWINKEHREATEWYENLQKEIIMDLPFKFIKMEWMWSVESPQQDWNITPTVCECVKESRWGQRGRPNVTREKFGVSKKRLGVCEAERREVGGGKVRGRCAFVYGCVQMRVRARGGVCSCLSAFAQRRTDMTGLVCCLPRIIAYGLPEASPTGDT